MVDSVKPTERDYDCIVRLRSKSKGIIGFNISGLLYVGGYSRNNMFGLKINYQRFVHSLIQFLIEKKEYPVVLVPHFFRRSGSIESDSEICRHVYDEFRNKYRDKILTVEGDVDAYEMKYIIGLCDFFIGSRMHACIGALSQCVPGIAIAYSPKFVGVIGSLGIKELVADPRMLGEVEILDLISKSIDKRQAIKDRLERCIPMVKRRTLELFRDIREELVFIK